MALPLLKHAYQRLTIDAAQHFLDDFLFKFILPFQMRIAVPTYYVKRNGMEWKKEKYSGICVTHLMKYKQPTLLRATYIYIRIVHQPLDVCHIPISHIRTYIGAAVQTRDEIKTVEIVLRYTTQYCM